MIEPSLRMNEGAPSRMVDFNVGAGGLIVDLCQPAWSRTRQPVCA
jgi:hypothetical protein